MKRWFVTLLIAVVSILGCAGQKSSYGPDSPLAGGRPDGSTGGSSTHTARAPWENWSDGRAIDGTPLRSQELIAGDRLLASGQREGALSSYERALTQGLSLADERAAVYRRSAVLLSLGQPQRSLTELSSFFRDNRLGVDQVSAEFSYLFGAAYGRAGNSDQAIAWLGRARERSSATSPIFQQAEDQVREVLVSVPESELGAITTKWADDSFVRSAVGQERARRAAGGEVIPNFGTAEGGAPSAPIKIGVLLPLAGRFQSLGMSARNGVQLALDGQPGQERFEAFFQDSGDLPDQAAEGMRTLVATHGATVILGPLISEQAIAVRDAAQQSKVPLVTFSKRADFIPGGEIFRLGATTESQIDSLLDVVTVRRGFTRFALVAPEEGSAAEVGNEFRQKVAERGLLLLYQGTYRKHDPNGALGIAAELEKYQVDGVFFADNSAAASLVFAALPEEYRARTKPLGIGNWDNRSQLENSRTVLSGAIFVSPFFSESQDPVVREFVRLYQERFQSAPDFLAAQGFDATSLILAAGRTAKSEGSSLVTALRGISEYRGLTGAITVGSDGELRRGFRVVQLDSDAIREVEASSPSALSSGGAGELAAPASAAGVSPTAAPTPQNTPRPIITAPTLGTLREEAQRSSGNWETVR